MKLTKQKLKEMIKEELVALNEGSIPFQDVLRMAPSLSRGYAVILGKRFENTPRGRAALAQALKDGSWKKALKETQKAKGLNNE